MSARCGWVQAIPPGLGRRSNDQWPSRHRSRYPPGSFLASSVSTVQPLPVALIAAWIVSGTGSRWGPDLVSRASGRPQCERRRRASLRGGRPRGPSPVCPGSAWPAAACRRSTSPRRGWEGSSPPPGRGPQAPSARRGCPAARRKRAGRRRGTAGPLLRPVGAAADPRRPELLAVRAVIPLLLTPVAHPLTEPRSAKSRAFLLSSKRSSQWSRERGVRRNNNSPIARNASQANSQTGKWGHEVTACDSGSRDQGVESLLPVTASFPTLAFVDGNGLATFPNQLHLSADAIESGEVSLSPFPRIASQDEIPANQPWQVRRSVGVLRFWRI
jgi:hypothetical protein